AEDLLAGEAGDDLGDHGHAGEDHDVNGGVAVEPAEVLDEDRVAAELGVEDADAEGALDHDEDEGDGDDGGAEDLDDAGGVVGPDEEGEAEPGECGGPHLVDGDDEVEA